MAKVKSKNVTIHSMGDLVHLINHNFSTFDWRIQKLAGRSRNLKLLCVVAIGCAIYTAVEGRKQEERLYQLSVRVKKLEHNEGE